MIGGFALVAFPAQYKNSGIMTFIVSHDGIVYEKDLRPKTAQVVGATKTFNPDQTWRAGGTTHGHRGGTTSVWGAPNGIAGDVDVAMASDQTARAPENLSEALAFSGCGGWI
jgi:DUF2950 family protein